VALNGDAARMDSRVTRLESTIAELRSQIRELHAELNHKETRDPRDPVIRESEWNCRMVMVVTLLVAYGVLFLVWSH
jgi:phage shock protein A